MQGSNFEAYIPTNTEIWKTFFAEVSEGNVTFQAFYTVDRHNQKGAGERAQSVKIISQSEESAEKTYRLSSAGSDK